MKWIRESCLVLTKHNACLNHKQLNRFYFAYISDKDVELYLKCGCKMNSKHAFELALSFWLQKSLLFFSCNIVSIG